MYLKIALISLFTVLLVPVHAASGWFGPESYYDCIEKNLPNAKDRYKLVEVRKMCRNKFPPKTIPKSELNKIEGKAHFGSYNYDDQYFSGNFYNGSGDWEIYSITIKVCNEGGTDCIKYSLSALSPIKPLSTGEASCKVLEEKDDFEWYLIEAKGYPYK